MTVVGVMSQLLRADRAVGYLEALGEPTFLVVPDDRRVEVGAGSSVTVRSPRVGEPTSERLMRIGLRGDLRSRAAAGSRGAALVEGALRRSRWTLRYLDRLQALRRRRRASRLGDGVLSAVLPSLEEVLDSEQVTCIVCFDVFDLPTVLTLAEPRHIPVKVR